MMPERKTMVSVRLPAVMVARLDFVARNTDAAGILNRSQALHAAIEAWLPGAEDRLVKLGIIEKKTR